MVGLGLMLALICVGGLAVLGDKSLVLRTILLGVGWLSVLLLLIAALTNGLG